MAEDTGQEKTEDPSEKKRDDSRNKGQTAFSRELSSAALLSGFTLVFVVGGHQFFQTGEVYVRDVLSHLNQPELSLSLLKSMLLHTIKVLAPLILWISGASILIGIAASVVQVGFHPTLDPLTPKFERISPFSGLKRIFSSHGLMELFKNLFKVIVLGYIGYFIFHKEIQKILRLSLLPIRQIIDYNFTIIGIIFQKIAMALVALAGFDWFYQKWSHEQQLKMTKEEVKEEHKQSEGNPQLKARVRQIQREMSRARMMQEVPKADAIVTNPTHYSVAILYDRQTMEAPQVIAKGADFLALRMRTIAKEHKIPILERPAVARDLYNNVEIGQAVPNRLYKAVAEVLAYVYNLKKKKI